MNSIRYTPLSRGIAQFTGHWISVSIDFVTSLSRGLI